jgi:hypothetical protein
VFQIGEGEDTINALKRLLEEVAIPQKHFSMGLAVKVSPLGGASSDFVVGDFCRVDAPRVLAAQGAWMVGMARKGFVEFGFSNPVSFVPSKYGEDWESALDRNVPELFNAVPLVAFNLATGESATEAYRLGEDRTLREDPAGLVVTVEALNAAFEEAKRVRRESAAKLSG